MSWCCRSDGGSHGVNDAVSRETPPAPPAPAEARGVFSEVALPVAKRYAELLAHDGVVRGLIGPRETPRLWDRHLLNCAVLGEAVPEGAAVCDIGSGAGLPGLALAIARPDLRICLVEPLLRRTTFLEEVVHGLGLDTVEVVRSRAEDVHGRREFDVVTSRAVAPLDKLVRWSLPLVRKGGQLVAMKGAGADEEITAAQKALRRYGAGRVEVLRLGITLVDPPTTVVRVEATKPSALRYETAPTGARRSSPGRRSRRKGPTS